jgi:hypothetical protein
MSLEVLLLTSIDYSSPLFPLQVKYLYLTFKPFLFLPFSSPYKSGSGGYNQCSEDTDDNADRCGNWEDTFDCDA